MRPGSVLMVLLVGLLSAVWSIGSWPLGLVAGASLVISMAMGTLAGSAIPLLMRRLGTDPAQSSAIFLIMITDGLAFGTFLGLASLAYRWLDSG